MPNPTILASLTALFLAGSAFAQLQMGPRMSPGGIPVLDNSAPPPVAASDVLAPPSTRARTVEPTEVLTGTAARTGQQHWVSLNLSILQPTTLRLGVKVWDRPNGSLWLEAYGGSELFNLMYGFGTRMQYTVKEFGHGDQLMIAPGLGAHILPNQRVKDYREYRDGYNTYGYYEWSKRNTAVFLVGDVDISWLHDFSPHFGLEVGVKLGLAVHLGGRADDEFLFFKTTFNSNLYPVVSFYSGFRF